MSKKYEEKVRVVERRSRGSDGRTLRRASCTAGMDDDHDSSFVNPPPATPGLEDGLPCGGLWSNHHRSGVGVFLVTGRCLGVFTFAPPAAPLTPQSLLASPFPCFLSFGRAVLTVLTLLLRGLALFFIFLLSCFCS